ncbi:MAG: hypothetical protein EXR62_10265 [Chloroflexi bacterium]|nr:hypothetical protein [Chloroflexota bacterium]
MIANQTIQVQCPQCKTPFPAQVYQIIDVDSQPNLKESLLRGQLNKFTCPTCQYRGALGTPLLYHDSSKNLAIVLMPMELNVKREAQEKMIGDLTNRLMESLPPEKRRAYLFDPKIALTFQGLVEEILAADGITREMLEVQTKRAKLVQELAEALSDRERFKTLAQERKAEITYEFYLTLTAAMEAAREDGDQVGEKRLLKVRQTLLSVTGGPLEKPLDEDESPVYAREETDEDQVEGPASEIANIVQREGFSPAEARQELLKAVVAAEKDADLDMLVGVNRELLDYSFFQDLTGQIEAAQGRGDTTESQRLYGLRSRILEGMDRVDAQTKAAVEQAITILREILSSEDPQQVVQNRLREIDDAFLMVLSANLEDAKRRQDERAGQALNAVYQMVVEALDQQLPPPVRLVNSLLRELDLEKRKHLMHEGAKEMGVPLSQFLREVAEDSEKHGQPELAVELRRLANEASSVFEVLRP